MGLRRALVDKLAIIFLKLDLEVEASAGTHGVLSIRLDDMVCCSI
jgi:hypothetical protein